MRFFLDLSYCGTHYNGWQNQKNQSNVYCIQNIIEEALFTLTRENHDLVGCGRTDAGVHAIHFIAHTDSHHKLETKNFISKLNQILPADIAIHNIFETNQEAHARFDAISRSYVYKIHLHKSPFPSQSYHYKYKKPDIALLNEAAGLLKQYEDFNTFCKTRTDVKTTLCQIESASWKQNSEDQFEFYITADRFLRGMVRLIVGMCLDVDRGKLSIQEVKKALETKTRLPRSWSVPPVGLSLYNIQYPEGLLNSK